MRYMTDPRIISWLPCNIRLFWYFHKDEMQPSRSLLLFQCVLFIIKQKGPWLSQWLSRLNQRPKKIPFYIVRGKETKPCAPDGCPFMETQKHLLPLPIWNRTFLQQTRMVTFIISAGKSLKTVSSNRCFVNSGALQWLWNFSNHLL